MALGDLLEWTNYSKLTKIYIALLMVVPAVTNYVALQVWMDAVYSSLAMILIGYLVPLLLLHYTVDRLISVRALAKDMEDRNTFIKKGLIMGVAVGAGLGLLFIGYCILLPWGPRIVALPMPGFIGGKFYGYWTLFFFLWVILLPIFEGFFFFLFQASSWKESWSDFMISAFYAVMNLAWMVHVVESWYSVLLLTGISFGVCYLCIIIRDRASGFQALGMRVGVGLGLFIMLVYLNSKGGSAKSPGIFFRAVFSNQFRLF